MASTKRPNNTWDATFPPRQETDEECSLFMRRMIYITFVQIIYARRLLPEDSFKKRRMDRMKLWLLGAHPTSVAIGEQLKGAASAMDKGYLRELHLVITDDQSMKAVETYKMGVTYAGDAPELHFQSPMKRLTVKYNGPEKVREQVSKMLLNTRKIGQRLAPLPDHCSFQLHIFYIDGKTPKGYQAPSFLRNVDGYELDEDIDELDLGDIHVKTRAVNLSIASKYMEAEEMEAWLAGDLDDVAASLFDAKSANTTLDDNSMETDMVRLPTRGNSLLAADIEKAAANMKISENGVSVSPSSSEEMGGSVGSPGRKTMTRGRGSNSPRRVSPRVIEKKSPGIGGQPLKKGATKLAAKGGKQRQ